MNDFKMATNRKQILKLTTSMTKIPELQSGRSMIEMLGVLAIIGVLSIGGVATFQYAMTKDKANKLIYDINLLREQTLTNAADVPAENFEPESGYQMSSRYGEGGIVSIMIDDLDQDVCERLLSMRFEDLRFLHAEQNTDILSCEGTPSFRAVFGLGDNAIIDEDACVIPCDSNHECHERRCCPKLADGICSATASGCPTQVAEDGTPCGTNQVCEDGECVCGLECEGEFVPNSACDACECGLECDNGGTPNESCTACENCDNSYGGTYCDVCEQNCQNSGTPIQNCSACECVNSWEGDNCETCGLDCQNGGAPNEDCSACECLDPWDGENCTTCTLQQSSCTGGTIANTTTCACECPEGQTLVGGVCSDCALQCDPTVSQPDDTCTACECYETGSDGKPMFLVGGTCLPYNQVCGTTPGTCKGACPDGCTVPAGEIINPNQDTGYFCENGGCYCLRLKDSGMVKTTYVVWMDEQWVSVQNDVCNGQYWNVNDDYLTDTPVSRFICYNGQFAVVLDPEDPYASYELGRGRGCGFCYAAGTMISLADGTCKRVEDIDYDDELLVWDFDNGCFSSAKPLFIKIAQESSSYNLLRFSDGSELKTIHQHRIFNIEAGKFTYPMTDDTPVGTHTFNANGEIVSLVSKEVIKKPVEYYNIITKHHLNCFASGILTSCRLNNMYPIRCMKFVKDNRELKTYSDYPLVPTEWIDGLRLKEQPTDINRDGSVNFNDKSVQDYALRLMNVDKKFVAAKKEAA